MVDDLRINVQLWTKIVQEWTCESKIGVYLDCDTTG